MIVNEYVAGQGISAHIDCIPCFGDKIISLSLGGAITMDFTRKDLKHNLRLAPRSLLIFNERGSNGMETRDCKP